MFRYSRLETMNAFRNVISNRYRYSSHFKTFIHQRCPRYVLRIYIVYNSKLKNIIILKHLVTASGYVIWKDVGFNFIHWICDQKFKLDFKVFRIHI